MPLSAWSTFYEVVGSAAGALVGIQFVVMALIASQGRRAKVEVVDAFGTPTVVHFCSALVVAAIGSAPWPTTVGAAAALGAVGVAGVAYKAVVVRRTRRQTSYKPELYDWAWYGALPAAAYATLAVAAVSLPARPVEALFAVAVATVGLLLVGIHNAWDTVTYLVTGQGDADRVPGGQPASAVPAEDKSAQGVPGRSG